MKNKAVESEKKKKDKCGTKELKNLTKFRKTVIPLIK